MKRNKHSLSNYKLLTADMGKLIPIGLTECLPGDTIQHSTSMLVRMSPLVAPVMHPVSVRIHHWFVPHRLSYDGWEDFITGGPLGTGSALPYPTNASAFTINQGTVGDYLGLPTGISLPANAFSTLPFQAYNRIYNEYYRDEDLCPLVAVDQNIIQNIAWEKDYFTTARPWAQKGPSITLPLGTSAPVASGTVLSNAANIKVRGLTGAMTDVNTSVTVGTALTNVTGSATGAINFGADGTNTTGLRTPILSADLTSATATDINAVRRAFALQRYQEARAQYGSRYTEYLRYIGLTPKDARMDRPEFLGGGKQTIAFSEILRTGNVAADNTTLPIGQLKGHGIAAMRSNKYRYFVEEHGYIISLMSVLPRSMYVNGIPRTWTKRTKEDYFQKELELIGQQAVSNSEVFAGTVDATNKAVFGYQDRYSEYRSQPSTIAGEFRSTLDYWHLARKFASLPVINASFVECDPSKRIFAEQTQNSMWIMANHNMQARRMVGHKTVGRVI